MKTLKKSLKEKGKGLGTESWGMLVGKKWVKGINKEGVIRREGGELRRLLGFLGAQVKMASRRRRCSAGSSIRDIWKVFIGFKRSMEIKRGSHHQILKVSEK